MAVDHENAGSVQVEMGADAIAQTEPTEHLLRSGSVTMLEAADAPVTQAPQLVSTSYRPGKKITPEGLLAEIEQGYQRLSGGNPEKAMDHFLRAAESMPTMAAAWHGLGQSCDALGKTNESLEFLAKACSLSPQTDMYWADYGRQLLAQGRLAEAVEVFSRSLRLQPENLAVHLMYGQALSALGLHEQALREMQFVLNKRPDSASAVGQLGNVLRRMGRLDEATEVYKGSLRLEPRNPETWHNLAAVHSICQRWDEAVACAAEAIHWKPAFWQAHLCLGLALARLKRYDDAKECYQSALQLSGGHEDIYLELGNLAMAQQNGGEAMHWYHLAIHAAPLKIGAILNAAGLLRLNGGIAEALKMARVALQVDPTNGNALNLEATCLAELGQMREALAVYQQILEKYPENYTAQINLLYNLNFHTAFEPEKVAAIHRAWGRIAQDEVRDWGLRHQVTSAERRKLRIGYVSGDFRRHSVMYFLSCLLEEHDRQRFDVFCYSAVEREDGVTAKIKRLNVYWRDISAMADQEAAKLIVRDQIDILVDLAGHTGSGRPRLFAAQLAPIQCSYLGYPNTTGLSTVDYRLVDSNTDPILESDGQTGVAEQEFTPIPVPAMGDEQSGALFASHHPLMTEKLVRLDPVFLCFEAPSVDVPIDPKPPSVRTGQLRFGTFNNNKKIDICTAEAWGALLRALPESRLILKCRSFGSMQAREQVLSLLINQGIAADRVEFRPSELSFEGHLAQYNDLDIALDTFPYNGTTTTMEALWMGVPVITLVGNTHAGRVGKSILTTLGKPEWVADTVPRFVDVGRKLASDPAQLAELRASMRDLLRRSPLMDAKGLTHRVETFYGWAWNEWVQEQEQPSDSVMH